MADVETLRELLILAIQDLADGEAQLIERVPSVSENIHDPGLAELIKRDVARSGEQRNALASMASELGAEASSTRNIWMRGILDDAENDARTIATGPLLDIALAGALRKAKQSERVSYETAIALAGALQMRDCAETLTGIRDAESETDYDLAESQIRLCVGLNAWF